MFHTLFNFKHLFASLDLAVIFAVTAAAVYFNDHLPVILRKHLVLRRYIAIAVRSEFYWPAGLVLVGCLMLLFVTAQMAISSLFVLGYGIWLIHRARTLVRV